MLKNEQATEIKNEEGVENLPPQKIKLSDGTELAAEEVEKAIRGKRKQASDFLKAQDEAKKSKAENDLLKQQIAALVGKNKDEDEDEDLSLPRNPEDVDPFFNKITARQKLLGKENKRLSQEVQEIKEGMFSEGIADVKEHNLRRLGRFAEENNITQDEMDKFWKLSSMHFSNKFKFGGKVLEISDEAMNDAYLILRKDEIVDKARGEGRQELTAEIFRPRQQQISKIAGGGAGIDEPDVAMMNANWHKYTPEQRKKYREKLRSLAKPKRG